MGEWFCLAQLQNGFLSATAEHGATVGAFPALMGPTHSTEHGPALLHAEY